MGQFQVVSGLMHQGGHTLDFMVCSDLGVSDLKMGDASMTPLSWTDRYLGFFRCTGMQSLYKAGRAIIRPTPETNGSG